MPPTTYELALDLAIYSFSNPFFWLESTADIAAWFALGPLPVLSWEVGSISGVAPCYYRYPLVFAPVFSAGWEQAGEGQGLKYDSHYGGYNLVAFFTDFMTAASYSRPMGARHRHRGGKGDGWLQRKCVALNPRLDFTIWASFLNDSWVWTDPGELQLHRRG